MTLKEFRPSGAIYKIDRIAGKGGSASVYKAVREDREGHSRQTVALKILKDKNAVSWLRKEFETLTQIRSVHCAQVLGWENLEVGPALVLEWIDGLSLVEIAESRSLNPGLITEITAQIQMGLRELASRGLHHGDLSPGNILIDRSGTVRLVDFATASSEPGAIIGTPAYISPEGWSGRPTSLSSDLFALGLILRDLETRFHDVPSSIEKCRERSMSARGAENPWLAEDPIDRKFSELTSNMNDRSELASLVAAILNEKMPLCERTQVISSNRKSWPLLRRVAALVGVTAINSIMPVRAQAPIPSPNAKVEQRAHLKVASHHWIFVTLNGKEIGYAPLEVKSLRPGQHRLSWKTATRSGEVLLKLSPGERIMLTEAELTRSR